MGRTPHQLLTHVDWHANGELQIRYSYPFAGPHELREQVIHVAAADVPSDIGSTLENLRDLLRARIEVNAVRFPHQKIVPTRQDGIMTVVTQDQRRPLPISRLYYNEIIDGVSKVEKQVRMEQSDFSANDRAVWKTLEQWVSGKAWESYKKLTKLDD